MARKTKADLEAELKAKEKEFEDFKSRLKQGLEFIGDEIDILESFCEEGLELYHQLREEVGLSFLTQDSFVEMKITLPLGTPVNNIMENDNWSIRYQGKSVEIDVRDVTT